MQSGCPIGAISPKSPAMHLAKISLPWGSGSLGDAVNGTSPKRVFVLIKQLIEVWFSSTHFGSLTDRILILTIFSPIGLPRLFRINRVRVVDIQKFLEIA